MATIWPTVIATMAAVISAFLAAYLTPRFAYPRFQREKLLERKLEVYSTIFKTLHEVNHWAHVRRSQQNQKPPVDGERKDEANAKFNSARIALDFIAHQEIWLISQPIHNRIKKVHDDIFAYKKNGSGEIYLSSIRATASATRDLRVLVREDLGYHDTPPWMRQLSALAEEQLPRTDRRQ